MTIRGGQPGASVDWATVMDDLLRGDPEKCDLAFRRLNRLLSGFLNELQAWSYADDWIDVRQAVVVKLVKSVRSRSLRDSHAFVSFARTVTRNEFYDLLRVRNRKPPLNLVDLACDSSIDEATLISVQTAFAKLPQQYQSAIHAVYVEDRTYQEAADTLGVPLGSLKRYLQRGLAELRELLGQKVPTK